MRTPTVSVVMPVFNGERFLAEAVESVLEQTFGDLELIAVDDGSTDATPDILARYAGDDARVRVLRQENGGIVSALNRGCAEARGRYVARMDADDIAFPDRLAAQVRFLEEHPDIALVGGSMILIDEDGRPLNRIDYPTDDETIKNRLLRENCVAHPTVTFVREVFAAAGGYRPTFVHAEDYDLWLRIADRQRLANLPEPLVYYRLHGANVTQRHLRQQVIAVLGAQAAAAIRRETGLDPVSDDDTLDPALLARLGVGEDDVSTLLREAYVGWAHYMLEAGRDDEAFALLDDAVRSFRGRPGARKALALVDIERAHVHFRRGEKGRAALCVLRAIVRRPPSLRALLARLLEPRGGSRARAALFVLRALVDDPRTARAAAKGLLAARRARHAGSGAAANGGEKPAKR